VKWESELKVEKMRQGPPLLTTQATSLQILKIFYAIQSVDKLEIHNYSPYTTGGARPPLSYGRTDRDDDTKNNNDDDDDNNNNSMQFCIYLRAELNSQWPSTVSTNTNNTGQNKQTKNITKKNCSATAF
jgi:hypothetical protein